MLLSIRRALALAVATLALAPASTSASSTLSPPLRRVALADSVAFEPLFEARSSSVDHAAVPGERIAKRSSTSEAAAGRRRIAHDEPFILTLRAFDQTFHLHLQPNDALVHPEGITVRGGAAGDEVLPRERVRAYHGVVVHPEHTARRAAEDRAGLARRSDEGGAAHYAPEEHEQEWASGVMGTAAIVLHDDDEQGDHEHPSFEGMLTWAGNTHTIQVADRYEASRQADDPPVHAHAKRSASDGRPPLVVHRRSDRMSEAEALAKRGLSARETPALGCSSDALEHNLQFQQSDSLHGDAFFEPPTALSLSMRKRSFADSLSDSLAPFSWARRTPELEDAETVLVPRTAVTDSFDYDAWRHRLQRRQVTGSDSSNSSFAESIGSQVGCPNAARVLYIGVAADCTYSGRFSNESDVRIAMLNNLNTVSNLYRQTFNVSIGVVELNVQSAPCPASPSGNLAWNRDCSSTYSLDNRLSDFSAWRGSIAANGTGLWHLMTACGSGQTGGEIGIAWLGTLCMTQASSEGSQVVSGTGVSSLTTTMWEVVAHEIGHNFGAIHDCSSGCALSGTLATQSYGATCCPSSSSTCYASQDFIMNPVSSPSAQTFSACSIGNICSMLGGGLGSDCVVAPGERTTLSTKQCGNGILEPGEECDAGPNGSACCSTECKLTAGSVCDPLASACCTDTCQFAPSTQVCRPAVDERCDIAETCSGTSSECPADTTKPDGESCASGGLTCASGRCTSRDLQCQQQGTSLGITRACPVSTSQGCSIACADPRAPGGISCLVFQQTFIDGTECGYGGRCRSGECVRGDWQSTFRNWYKDNLRISIPVTIAIAIVVLLFLSCIVRACRRNRAPKQPKRGSRVPPVAGAAAGSRGATVGRFGRHPPPQQQPQLLSDSSSSSHSDNQMRQSGVYAPPSMPPPPPPPRAHGSGMQQQTRRPPPPAPRRASAGYASPPVPPRPAAAPTPSGWVDTSRYNGY